MCQILIIYTGGTIGMMSDPKTKVLKPINFEQIMENVPELERLNCRIKVHSFAEIIDSSNMNPLIWSELAELIEKNYDKVDGFVILHGSDTMSFTASALSFMLENLNKPVIVTGSQIPLEELRSDGQTNFFNALYLAANYPINEVTLFFNNQMFRGNRATKAHADGFDAFASPNLPQL